MLYAQPHELLTREQLHEIPVPARTDVSDRWLGVQHGEFADLIVSGAERLGISITKEVWKTNPNQTDLFGSIDLAFPTKFKRLQPDFGQEGTFSLGVRHSNASKYAVTFSVGARVAVCENGLITGEFILAKKHTKNIDLNELVSSGITKYINEAGKVNSFVEDLRETLITDDQAATVLLESGRRGILGWANVGRVDEEYRNPEFSEFKERSEWSLYNSFTRVIQNLSGPNQMEALRGIRELF